MKKGFHLCLKDIHHGDIAFFPTFIIKPAVKKRKLLKCLPSMELRIRIRIILKFHIFCFLEWCMVKKIETESGYSLQPSEDNSAIMNQNPKFCEAWNPNPDVDAPLPVAEPCFLPGFQQTFGREIQR
ncbi:hypothetical protein CEXT_773991 [Caerostris extrusa]|uniref:Uncharacterized protein n=1 Tax=Caerostris extrusa TaxID=172846 RepID=A0AAV4RG01_CAEEX|nr:hypothetical protein CEXT_773991 [Caerostris extrusa]